MCPGGAIVFYAVALGANLMIIIEKEMNYNVFFAK